MKRWGVCLLGLFAILMACKSPPATVEQPPEGAGVVDKGEAPAAAFAITQEVYDTTLAEVKRFVDGLNSLIANKNYEGWKAALSDEFFTRISSPEFLASTSQSAALKSRRIVLKSPDDYFLQVVVPSRNDSTVDEIEFTASDRVKVFYREERVRRSDNTSTTEVRRLRLYELIKNGSTWKIID